MIIIILEKLTLIAASLRKKWRNLVNRNGEDLRCLTTIKRSVFTKRINAENSEFMKN